MEAIALLHDVLIPHLNIPHLKIWVRDLWKEMLTYIYIYIGILRYYHFNIADIQLEASLK